MRYNTIGLIGKPAHAGTTASLQTLVDYLNKRNCTVLVAKNVAGDVKTGHFTPASLVEIGEAADLAIVVGGDGNMLGAARVLARYNIHVVGVNRGKLGFLADINPDEIEQQLASLLAGQWHVEDRFLLEVEVHRDGVLIHKNTAVNEIVLHHGKVAHMMQFEIFLDDKFVSSQRADGMIVSTPTGSTAYSLSGGGPILMPTLNALNLVPMFPHTLTSRPIVVDANSRITMHVSKDNSDSLQVSCDSHIELPVRPGDYVSVKKCSDSLRMVHSDSYDYFAVLRKKLNWGSKRLE